MSSFNLANYRWKNRLLLVFAPSKQNSAYQAQMQLFDQQEGHFINRDLMLVEVFTVGESCANGESLDNKSAAQLREHFKVGNDEFCAILIGKDGGEKRRDTVPVQLETITSQIDTMPMRQQEMDRS